MQGTMTREQVNAAVWQVLMHQYKKDAKEAHEIVKQAGYSIEKLSGCWRVYNEKTGRSVYVNEGNSRSYLCRTTNSDQRIGWKAWEPESVRKVAKKFDLVGFLDKPVNRDWAAVRQAQSGWAMNRFERSARQLKDARWSVRHHTDRIKSMQAQIAKLQEQLLREAQEQVKAEQRLQQVRKELGLVK